MTGATPQVPGAAARAVSGAPVGPLPVRRSELGRIFRALLRNRGAMVGLAIVAVYVLIALGVDWLPLRNPLQMVGTSRFAGPGSAMPFGADSFGRDLLSRILFGA